MSMGGAMPLSAPATAPVQITIVGAARALSSVFVVSDSLRLRQFQAVPTTSTMTSDPTADPTETDLPRVEAGR